MGRWIKIYGDEQKTSTPRYERKLERMEKTLFTLTSKEFAKEITLTEKQKGVVFAYGLTLQMFGRVRWLDKKETEIFDRLALKRLFGMLEYKGTVQEYEEATQNDELAQYVRSLPKRYVPAK